MERFLSFFRLAGLLVALFPAPALGADLVSITASATPGAPRDGNGSGQVWQVQQGSQTGAGLVTVGSDPHLWQIYCLRSGAGSITQTHIFTGGPLTPGEMVSLDYETNRNVDAGKRVGLRLVGAHGKPAMELAFTGGQHDFVHTDAGVTNGPTGQAFDPNQVIHFSFLLTSPTTYTASCNEDTWSGTCAAPVAGIEVFNDGAGEFSDQYSDHLAVTRQEPVAIDRQVQIGAGMGMFVPKGYDPMQTPSLAFAQPPKEKGPLPATWKLAPKFDAVDGRSEVTLAVPLGSSLYGTGEVAGPLLRNGKSIALWNTDNFAYLTDSGHRLYQSHPWVLGVRPDGTAFGIIFDTTWKAVLSTQANEIDFKSEGGPCRVVVIDRASPQAVLEGLADLTGKMPLPPRWSLGFNQCRYSYAPDAKVREIANHFREDNLPCDVIWMDIGYMNGYRIFTFDPQGFSDPQSTNDFLHALNFHSVWIIDPGVKIEPGYPVYDSGQQVDAWVQTKDGTPYVGKVWPGDCNFPDFTRPETRKWWSALYGDFLAKGADGIWNDMNEPAVMDSPSKTMPEDNKHRGGGGLPPGPHTMYHNAYGMLMVSATRQGILDARPNLRPFVLTRSNYLGGQRYSATWTGDNSAEFSYLQTSIPMLENLGLSGQPVSGPDIGGYSGSITPDLYEKWMSMVPFYPFARAHTAIDNPPREPWVFGPEVEAVARTALERRYRLLPYLYSLAYVASTAGTPILRPVFFADPSDMSLRAEDSAFLLGPNLLVVPQWAKGPHLPSGTWRDVYLLGAAREKDGYQATIKIRGGAIVPLGRVVQSTKENSLDPLTLLVCLNDQGVADGDLYEDAGDGFDYTKGEYSLTHYHAEQKRNDVVVKIAGREGKLKVADRTIRVEIVTPKGVGQGEGLESKGVQFAIP